ncbi:CD1375 family protein [Vagococcus salmoninarum]|nr:CD1375 family protein [Vagococcus salmoninarum]
MDMIASFYCESILLGDRTIDDVPVRIRHLVEQMLATDDE